VRKIDALSPTSMNLYWSDTEAWYIKYMSENRLPRAPQTRPMSVGSAFDALIKATLYRRFYGEVPPGHKYSAQTMLKEQVEEPIREWATTAGLNALIQYQNSGALADLILETAGHQQIPQFEFTVRETISFNGFDVPILGKPDMYYMTSDGLRVILDWKVNGYCAKSPTSPAPGYIKCRDGWDFATHKPSRSHNMPHPNANPHDHRNFKVSSVPLEEASELYASQTATYAWLMGEPIGSDNFVCAIEQLCGYPFDGSDIPGLRIASHRSVISPAYQETLVGKYVDCWKAYKTGHIFLAEARDASDKHCTYLDKICEVLMKGEVDGALFTSALEFVRQKDRYDPYRDWRKDIILARRAAGESGLPDPDCFTANSNGSAPTVAPGLITVPEQYAIARAVDG
jgi:hypothetical protein